MVTSHMNTVQEPLVHSVSPPPCSIKNPAELNRADLPTNKANNNHEPLKSQISEIPFPSHFHIDTTPLPERCQFMFSDGRQCTMARSEIHPSLCTYHSEREEQLFGDPGSGHHIIGRSYDLPELYCACRDLTTAAGVNRALAQVFRLLAQRRISRQEAATFAKLGHLLLQSISAAAQQNLTIPSGSSAETYPAASESHHPPQKGYSPAAKVCQEVRFSGPAVTPGIPETGNSGGVCRTPEMPHFHPASRDCGTGDELSRSTKTNWSEESLTESPDFPAQPKSDGPAPTHAFSIPARSTPATPSQ